MKDERLYLSNIQECIERIEEYTKGGKEDWTEFIWFKQTSYSDYRKFITDGKGLSLLNPANIF